MGAIQAPIGHHRTKQTPAVFGQFPYRTTLDATTANEVVRFLQPVTMKTPAASATVTIFNRIKSGQMLGMEGGTRGPEGTAPQVIQSARRHRAVISEGARLRRRVGERLSA